MKYFVGVIFLISSIVHAEHHDLYTKVSEVYINNQGAMLLKVDALSGYIKVGDTGNKTAEVMYSTALAAKLANKENVWIRYWDTESGFPTLGIISIR